MNAAETLAKRQRRYDLLHHKSRLAWLSGDEPRFACGTPVLPSERVQMIAASKAALAAGLGDRSVDLNDADYLADLDKFAALPA